MFVAVGIFLLFQQVLSACVLQDVCTERGQVQEEIVSLHNQLRRSVSPSAQDMLQMSWSDDIKASMQTWVDKCKMAHGPPSTRLINGYEMGENLFYSSTQLSWTAVITAWHNEVQNYQYPTGSTNGKEVGHYTQVIWNSSYKVGCAMAVCPNNIYFYGCQYYRAGNFRGWNPYTEGSRCGMCPSNCVNKLCTNPCPYINRFLNCPALKNTFGCVSLVKLFCPASCSCSSEIIPVYRK